MQQNEPSLWALLLDWFVSMTDSGKGTLMAMLIATLRIMYDDRQTHWLRISLEAFLCGALSLWATSVVHWFRLPPDAAIAAGGAIGFVGVNALREYLLRWLSKKTNG